MHVVTQTLLRFQRRRGKKVCVQQAKQETWILGNFGVKKWLARAAAVVACILIVLVTLSSLFGGGAAPFVASHNTPSVYGCGPSACASSMFAGGEAPHVIPDFVSDLMPHGWSLLDRVQRFI